MRAEMRFTTETQRGTEGHRELSNLKSALDYFFSLCVLRVLCVSVVNLDFPFTLFKLNLRQNFLEAR